MFAVEMALTEAIAVAKLSEDDVRRRRVQSIEPRVADDRRFKAAINAPPFVALEAKDAQSLMVLCVTTLRW